MEDLWPKDFGEGNARTPSNILKEQASILTKKTKGVIEASVATSSQDTIFVHSFWLNVPAMNDYRYKLIEVRHDIKLYPIYVETSMLAGGGKSSDTESEFLDILKEVFNHKETKDLIVALITQSQ